MTEQITELKQRLVVGHKQDGRCCYDPQAKRELIEACFLPGVSVAKLALAHGINANLLRRWVREAEMKPPARALAQVAAQPVQAPRRETLFVPVNLPAPAAPTALVDIRIELQRGATAVTVTWPASAAAECAAWMRELLR